MSRLCILAGRRRESARGDRRCRETNRETLGRRARSRRAERGGEQREGSAADSWVEKEKEGSWEGKGREGGDERERRVRGGLLTGKQSLAAVAWKTF